MYNYNVLNNELRKEESMHFALALFVCAETAHNALALNNQGLKPERKGYYEKQI